jgi:hypothetical protein
MAYSTSNKFSIAAGSPPQIVGAFDKFEMHATPKYPCGYKVEMADGSVYRYGHFGANTSVGRLVSEDVSETSLTRQANKFKAPAASASGTDGAVGSRYLQATLAGVGKDLFAGAKVVMTADTGLGYTYDIIGNTATDNPVSGDCRIELAQPIQVAIDATTDIHVTASPYQNLEGATDTDIHVAGVACSTMVVADAPWGWIQTKGKCGVLSAAAVAAAVGAVLTTSNTAGAFQLLGGTGTDAVDLKARPIIGYALSISVSAEISPVMLMLD